MIELAEIKSFLSIDNTAVDSELLSFIESAKSRLDTLCGRSMGYALSTDYIIGNGGTEIYLKNNAVESIETLQYYDTEAEAWTDLIDGSGDTILNSTEIRNSKYITKLILRKGYTFTSGYEIKITYYSGYKTNTISKTITDIVQGTGDDSAYAIITIGSHSYTAGSIFYIQGVTDFQNNPNNEYKIISVTATEIYIEWDLGTGTYSSGGTAIFNSNLFNSTPYELKMALKYEVQFFFYDSPVSQIARAGIKSKNIGGQSSSGETYESIEETRVIPLIKPYRIINV